MLFRRCCLNVIVLFTWVSFVNGQVAESAFRFAAGYTGEGYNVFSGGIRTGAGYEGLATFGVEMDTRKAGWFNGGTLSISGANTHGGTPSQTAIGDFQMASNIEAGNLTFLQECWYRQEIGNWTVIAGLQDLNVELVASEAGSLFLNSSLGTPSTIANNVPSPIFPLTSLGFQLHYAFNPNATLKLAVFDGMPEDLDTNPYNAVWHINSKDGYLAFAELNLKSGSKAKHPGVYKLGVYHHNHIEHASLPNHQSNYGGYLTIDQNLYATVSGKSLTGFLQLALNPARLNPNSGFLAGGIRASGWISGRSLDELGLALAQAAFIDKKAETALECFYRFQCGSHVFIQPDIQYIIHPSATNQTLPNALVGFLRFGIEL